MFRSLKRWWRYWGAKLGASFEERADPKIQLEQAIAEAQEQHQRLKGQAANVIANQKQAELRLNRSIEELEKLNVNARQALRMSDDAGRAGDRDKAVEYEQAAEAFATRMIAVEREVEETKALVLQASQAADQSKAAVKQNAAALQAKLTERQKLLSQLDQAKMQEEMNKAMATLGEAVGQDVPTFAEVRDKIEARYARAKGTAELTGESVESRMIEIEQASMNVEARTRVGELRAELGLPPGEGARDELLAEAAELEKGDNS